MHSRTSSQDLFFQCEPQKFKKRSHEGGANTKILRPQSAAITTQVETLSWISTMQSLEYRLRSSAKQQRRRMQRRGGGGGGGGVDNRVVLLLAAALLFGYCWTTTYCQAFRPSSTPRISSSQRRLRHPVLGSQSRRSTNILPQEGQGGRSSSGAEQIFRLHSSSSSIDRGSKDRPRHQISIEYCTGCRWNLRAFWMAQELLTTFCSNGAAKNNKLEAVTLIPCSADKTGRFVVKCYDTTGSTQDDRNNENPIAPPATILWDRTEMKEGFPELKRLKQMVRDVIDPDRSLGHSDRNNSDSKDDQKQQQAVATIINHRVVILGSCYYQQQLRTRTRGPRLSNAHHCRRRCSLALTTTSPLPTAPAVGGCCGPPTWPKNWCKPLTVRLPP